MLFKLVSSFGFICDSRHNMFFLFIMINLDSANQQFRAVCSEWDLLKVIMYHIYISFLLLFEVIFICWRKWIIFRSSLSGSAAFQHCWLAVLEKSIRGWISQWPFRQPTHTQPPVTSSALTWHVKTPLKAPRHPPVPAHLIGCTWHTKYTLVCSHVLSHNKTTQSCSNILPTLCMQSHVSQMLALSFSPPSLILYLSPLSSSISFFLSHMQTHSVDQSPWIGLIACRPSAD